MKYDRPKLRSLRYQINNNYKKRLEYFEKLIDLELTIDYENLYYQSGNKSKDVFKFKEFGSMDDFYQRINAERITFDDAESKLVRFRNLLHMLEKIATRKRSYNEKRTEVLQNAKLLFKGQKLIYTGFIDKIFGKGLMGNRFGGEDIYSEVYDENDDENDYLDTTGMPDLENEESAAQRNNQTGQGLKILTPDQMFSRLPITLAQLQAENNPEYLKKEIRQLLCSFYLSKILTKTIHKHLINTI